MNLSGREVLRLAEFRAMAEEQLVRLGAAIERERKRRGWSRSRLARELPVDVKTIERWEKAQTGGAMDSLTQIAEALETTADELLASSLERDEQEPSPDPFGPTDSERLDRIEERQVQLLEGVARLDIQLDEVLDLLRRQSPSEERAPKRD